MPGDRKPAQEMGDLETATRAVHETIQALRCAGVAPNTIAAACFAGAFAIYDATFGRSVAAVLLRLATDNCAAQEDSGDGKRAH